MKIADKSFYTEQTVTPEGEVSTSVSTVEMGLQQKSTNLLSAVQIASS